MQLKTECIFLHYRLVFLENERKIKNLVHKICLFAGILREELKKDYQHESLRVVNFSITAGQEGITIACDGALGDETLDYLKKRIYIIWETVKQKI